DGHEEIDRLEAEVRREGLRAAGQARSRARGRFALELGEIDAVRAAEDPGAELAAQARRLLAAPHRGRAPVLDPLEELDARELAACSGLRLRPREDALARERYLFYTSVSRATERVILSYRSSDEEGNLALPSPFLADVAELLADDWHERRRRRMLADVVWPV